MNTEWTVVSFVRGFTAGNVAQFAGGGKGDLYLGPDAGWAPAARAR